MVLDDAGSGSSRWGRVVDGRIEWGAPAPRRRRVFDREENDSWLRRRGMDAVMHLRDAGHDIEADAVIELMGRLPDELVTREELARALRVSVPTIDRMRREGMPDVSLGPRLLSFRLSECLAWARARAPEP